MECKFWEERGLLFTSGELDEKETREYEDHLHTCDICRNELQLYQNMKHSFFEPHMLEELPSAAVDREILRVCSMPARPAIASTLFSTYIKKAVYAALILAVGFAGGAYFMGLKVDSDMKSAENATIDKEQTPQTALPPAVASKQDLSGKATVDSAGSDSAAQIIKRGNLQTQGVVPVDLKDE